jgi:hypothetical protein
MREFRVLIGSDPHGSQREPEAWDCFLNVAGDKPYDLVILNGDWADFSQLSGHDKSLGNWEDENAEDISLDEELDIVEHEILAPLRKALGKKTKIMLRLGNHETRFLKVVKSNPDAILELMKTMRKRKTTDLAELLHLSRYDMELSKRPEEDLFGFTVIHGVKTGPNVARANLKRYGSGTSGHSHRINCHTEIMHGKLQGWWESGCLCKTKNIPYLPLGDRPDWANGYLTLTVDRSTGEFWCTPHVIINGKTDFDGRIIKA